MKKTIFLTGSKGFIGSHLLKALDGYYVYCADRNELPTIAVDYVIHLAGVTTTTDSFVPELYVNNIVYPSLIFSQCNPKKTKIIYASSTSASELINPYSYTKRYLEWLGESYGNSTGLRFFNVYGNGCKRGIVKRAIDCANNGEVLDLYGGCNVRDFIYIDDVVNAIVASLDSTEKIIEVGTGIGISIESAVEKIATIINKPIEINHLPRVKTDMKFSVAEPHINDYIGFERGILKMLNK